MEKRERLLTCPCPSYRGTDKGKKLKRGSEEGRREVQNRVHPRKREPEQGESKKNEGNLTIPFGKTTSNSRGSSRKGGMRR